MKYKIGDKVRVRKDLKVGESYGAYFIDDMSNFIGKEVTIDRAGSCGYKIKEDNFTWFWTDEMFEEVKEDIMDAVMGSIYISKLKGLLTLCSPISYIEAEGGNQMTDIETLKSFNPKNLSEGKRQAEEEKANYEASEAKKSYTTLINKKEELERIIKTTNEELKKVKESLAVFK